ncbi:MAG TPA: peptide chain release factor N(5)-glutamine methyltransferase [Rickettsiales bacterium]|nr:peptide chain release factor N(5)-glutamine methyltransferase [Rickettsiales bacterium]
MKLKELFKNSIILLKDRSIETPNLDVKILLSFLLKLNPNDLINHFDEEISCIEIEEFNKLLNRRLNREPIANIIGEKNFWDYEFIVNENVLTPRPDSETLIEAIIKNFPDTNKNLKILDLGTGSGCLILTILKIYKNSFGTAIDISEKALDIAKRNAKKLNITNIQFFRNNWNDNKNDKFDLIISNPPYIPKDEIKELEPEVNIFNPILALDGGDDGLECYRFLAKNLNKNCNQYTKIFLEIGKGQEKDIQEIFENEKFILNNSYKDINQIIRVLEFCILKI